MEQQTISQSSVEVKKSTIHGLGLFATASIKKDELIAEYKGELISGDEGDRRSIENENEYIMCFDDERDIDGDIPENVAKYVNHGCDFNVTFEVKDDKLWCIALRDIQSGEELTTDYEMDCHELLPCACGSPNCKKYMNHPEDIPELLKEAEEERKSQE